MVVMVMMVKTLGVMLVVVYIVVVGGMAGDDC